MGLRIWNFINNKKGLTTSQSFDIIESEREEIKMKITIKNQEYKLLHNIPKGTKLVYNDEECIKAEKSNMLVGINTGNIYTLPPTKKICINNERKKCYLVELRMGDFFILNKEVYVITESGPDFNCCALNLHSKEILILDRSKEVERIQDKNIQIKVK